MVSKTPDLLAFPTKHKRQVLTQSQLDSLKSGTYQILEEVGIRFPSQEALKVYLLILELM